MTDVHQPGNGRGNSTGDPVTRPPQSSGRRRSVPAWVVIVVCASVVAAICVVVTRDDPASLTTLTTVVSRCLVTAALVLVLVFSMRLVWASAAATWTKIGLVLVLAVITAGLIIDAFYHPETFDPSRWGGPTGLN